MKQTSNLVGKIHFIYSVVYISLSYLLPSLLIFRHKYATYSAFILIFWFFNRSRISYSSYVFFGVILFPFAYIADFFKNDTLSLYLSSISLLNFLFSVFVIVYDHFRYNLTNFSEGHNK
ncbi:MAG: hypothetical protein ACD_22C00276G0002 [uncultured bacterium]|nr:hypothetical protein P147_WWE3C00001G0114 [candidate division WWE3 bacterium RAAC2_WWE3_1]EKD99386.1 MAG: hypothetical protein ACD_22C00276G0002 [uncultured bacterium]OGC68548.1 MAG: hypothetical protein A2364_01200 [candidate division WWE3 bacterium RIFOXYB1_FULL_43_12]HAI95336.1 hypothetical protein [candidate division WWE3 bacterium]